VVRRNQAGHYQLTSGRIFNSNRCNAGEEITDFAYATIEVNQAAEPATISADSYRQLSDKIASYITSDQANLKAAGTEFVNTITSIKTSDQIWRAIQDVANDLNSKRPTTPAKLGKLAVRLNTLQETIANLDAPPAGSSHQAMMTSDQVDSLIARLQDLVPEEALKVTRKNFKADEVMKLIKSRSDALKPAEA
jgi:hypothetical protein